MSFCTEHAFYDCPVCRGEQPAWVIPIVEDGKEVGQVVVPAVGEILLTGDTSSLPRPGDTAAAAREVTVPSAPVPRPPEAIDLREFFSTAPPTLPAQAMYDLEAARERGREVYRKALLLAAQENIPLMQAIVTVGEAGG